MSERDIVLRGGRVIDPESGLDAVRDVAIARGRVVEIGTALPAGNADVGVAGMVVTAGRHAAPVPAERREPSLAAASPAG